MFIFFFFFFFFNPTKYTSDEKRVVTKSSSEGFVIHLKYLWREEENLKSIEKTVGKREMSSSLPLRLLLPLTTSLICPSPDSHAHSSLLRYQNPNFNRRSSSSSATSCSSQWQQFFPGKIRRFRSYSPCIPMVSSDSLSHFLLILIEFMC